jgi:F-type H+-transporting ATPase subunit 8
LIIIIKAYGSWDESVGFLVKEARPTNQRKKIKSIKTNNMPQLIPFYFLNQLFFSFLTFTILIYVLSKYVLPLFTYKNVVRLYLTKLTNKS